MSYNGKRLSMWLDDYSPRKPLQQRQAAGVALTEIGTNAIPDLVEMVGSYDHPIKKQLMKLTDRETFLRIRLTPSWVDHRRAQEGFRILGPDAAVAVPQLIKLLSNQPSGHTAVDALARIGEASVPALTNALSSPKTEIRIQATRALGKIGWEAEAAIPYLLSGLQDSDRNVRSESSLSLAEIGEEPALVVPALAQLIDDEDPMVRQSAIESLGDFRETAKPALGSLFKALFDDDRYVRFSVLTALQKIDPRAAVQGTNILQRGRPSSR
jgi:HEAT repeat protein